MAVIFNCRRGGFFDDRGGFFDDRAAACLFFAVTGRTPWQVTGRISAAGNETYR
jgi:hypothetical protein